MLLFECNDGDDDFAPDSVATSESATDSFASAASIDDDEYGDDKSYVPILLEILREGKLTYLTAYKFPYLNIPFK